MANNIDIGQNIVTAKETVNIADTGINAGNTLIIYSFEATVSKSYVPGRPINPLTQFEIGKSYLIKATAALDMTEHVFKGIPAGSSGNTFVTEEDEPFVPES